MVRGNKSIKIILPAKVSEIFGRKVILAEAVMMNCPGFLFSSTILFIAVRILGTF
jgi:hypothetical protein